MATAFEKTALSADLSASLAARNIIRHAKSQPLLHYPQDICFGAPSPPNITVISLYKYDGIMQLNNFVYTGRTAALMKWLIEVIFVAAAKYELMSRVWMMCERMSVLLGRYLFRGKYNNK